MVVQVDAGVAENVEEGSAHGFAPSDVHDHVAGLRIFFRGSLDPTEADYMKMWREVPRKPKVSAFHTRRMPHFRYGPTSGTLSPEGMEY